MTNRENLGPAEKIIQSLLAYSDHAFHGRPGLVTKDARINVGVRWVPVTSKTENNETVIYQIAKKGKTQKTTRLGVVNTETKIVTNAGAVVGEFRDPGIFPEVATWFYRQIAEVWQLDNEFAARWASRAFDEKHMDLKVILAAFLIVQSRKGDPIVDAGKFAFHDDDYRNVGEAMMLLRRKDGDDLSAKHLLRVRMVLTVPAIAELNRQLGFTHSTRKTFLGRWPTVVDKWLEHHDANPKILAKAVKAGYRTQIMKLARHVGYKPTSAAFYEVLRWKQVQAEDGRRTIAIGTEVAAAETWAGLTEEQVCEKIVKSKYDWKRITALLPSEVGVTRATMAAAIQINALSNRDLVIQTPTLEELGLLNVQTIRAKWEAATKAATDMRALNIARNVRTKDVAEKLAEAADAALKTSMEEVTRGMRVYVFIDVSGSMSASIDRAKELLKKFLQGFPLDRTHVATFNTNGVRRTIKAASAAGVERAFVGIRADGGTTHGAGVMALSDTKPADDEDSLFIFVGDGGERGTFTHYVNRSGLRPTAFGFLKLPGDDFGAINATARELNIPCFEIDLNMFDVSGEQLKDAYAIPRILRNLIAATPVNAAPRANVVPVRASLIDVILKTELLQRPAWAS